MTADQTTVASQNSLGDDRGGVYHGGKRLVGDHGAVGEERTSAHDRRGDDRADAVADGRDDSGSSTGSGDGDSQDGSEDSLRRRLPSAFRDSRIQSVPTIGSRPRAKNSHDPVRVARFLYTREIRAARCAR